MKKWKMPDWMKEYKEEINNTGGNSIEEIMNDNKTDVLINAPKAMICVAVKSQVYLLTLLHDRGKL